LLLAAGFIGSLLGAGCAPEKLRVPSPQVAVPKSVAADAAVGPASIGAAVDGGAVTSAPPAAEQPKSDRKIELISAAPPAMDLPQRADTSGKFPNTNALTAAAEGMPTRNFINYVFGELLKVNYILVDGTPGLDDPVTFNAQKPVSSRQLFKLVGELLATRSISIVEKEGTYFIGPANAKTQQGLPIGYGRNPVDVPDLPGNVFQIVPLRYGPNNTLFNAAQQFTNLTIFVDNSWDAYLVTGPRSEVLKLLDLVRLFDRPSVKGSRIGLINLTYIGPAEFVSQVAVLLANEGIVIGGNSPLTMVPLDRLGGVVAFSSSDVMLERLEFWAKQLDRPGQGPTERYFVYQPKFARAADLGESLAGLLGGGGSALGNRSRDTRSALGAAPSSTAVANADTVLRRDAPIAGGAGGAATGGTIAGDGVTLSIDTRSNSLIFYTTGPRYEALLPMIRRLDIPPKQIVLEAMIAEVSLTGEFQNGVEFAFREGKVSGGTAGGLGLPSGGLALTYDVGIGEQIRMRLQASDTRVNVLSNPILVVKDGVSATIQVGNDVPTVGATASDPIQSNRTVTTVLYRNTGLNLSITPNINAQGSVLLTISQSTTNTVPGSSGVAGAPIFFQRSVNTEVVAGSGQTVFLAGLRSESNSTTSTKVPGLGSLPLVGSLFSSDTRRREKTELVILITPRIIDDMSEWRDVMNGLSKSMQLLSLPAEPTTAAP
jgi:general secretion pathway protein D